MKKVSKVHRFESKSGISINDVREKFAKEKYTFARVGKSLNFVVNKGTETKVIKCGTTIGDLYKTLNASKSITAFIDKHEIKTRVSVKHKGGKIIASVPKEKKISKTAQKKITKITNKEVDEINTQMVDLSVKLMSMNRWLVKSNDPALKKRNPEHLKLRAQLHKLNDRLSELTGGIKEDKLSGLSQEDLGELQRRGEHRKAEKKAKKKERGKSKRGKNDV